MTSQHHRQDTFSCFLIGSESLLIQASEVLRGRGHRVLGIITDDPKIRDWADDAGIEHIDASRPYVERLAREPFDYLFSVAWLSLVPTDVLELPTRGAINFHDGPLPEFAGLNTPVWGLLQGVDEWGVTWHRMTEGVDEGEILSQRRFEVSEKETSITLNTKCYQYAIESFETLVDELAAGTARGVPQDFSQRSVFRRDQRPDAACVVDWNRPAEDVCAFARALDFGTYANPIGLPKLVARGQAFSFREAQVVDDSAGAPGVITALDADGLSVAAADGVVRITELLASDGRVLAGDSFATELGVGVGDRLDVIGDDERARLGKLHEEVASQESHWIERLANLDPLELPSRGTAREGGSSARETRDVELTRENVTRLVEITGVESRGDAVLLATAMFFGRLCGKITFDVGFRDDLLHGEFDSEVDIFAPRVPLRLAFDPEADCATLFTDARESLATCRRYRTHPRDLVSRAIELRPAAEVGSLSFPNVTLRRGAGPAEANVGSGDVEVRFDDDGLCCWSFDPGRYDASDVDGLIRRSIGFFSRLGESGSSMLVDVPLLDLDESQLVLRGWNDTAVDYPRDDCIHDLIAAQVARTPDAIAVAFCDEELTYRELDAQASRVARHLVDLGVRPESLVGISVERSPRLLVALLGVLKAGGAYVPLDPDYPPERLALMIEDSGLRVIVSESSVSDRLPSNDAHVVVLDRDAETIDAHESTKPSVEVSADNLAYVIYTSGSTGKPKGVLVTHRNVGNFFVGMDERIQNESSGEGAPGTWLAVTSLSFDISVLELFWTLARGFKIVLFANDAADESSVAPVETEAPDFSLFYFASDASQDGDKYRLLLDGARFGDENGFCAVWTPERHFHAFGGIYPNPSVISAAIAATTKNIGIRAGSCVLPLHHPVRVAEEWSVVDNLSGGRVGISFAAGWQPNDFLIRPETFADRKDVMFRDIEVVKRLWRGEKVEFDDAKGGKIEVSTLPRPVQPELPVWVTVAGNPETFRQAGEIGANLLTHLLGQSVDELREKIEVYRRAWREAGHPGEGTVSLMLHTFVGESDEHAREVVREPLKAYLKSAVHLIKQAAWSFPTFKQRADRAGTDPGGLFDSLDLEDEDMDALLDHAFSRYYETSGLFGTPQQCADFALKVAAVGVDEVACLIDFGIDPQIVLDSFERLGRATELARESVAGVAESQQFSIPNLVERHSVTHLQCTPSLAGMLTADPASRAALGKIDTLMVGGEACPKPLVDELCSIAPGRVLNMYGPTETTIWSSTHTFDANEDTVPIGKPIANTELYVLDAWRKPVPPGVPGELWIGGEGVARGYHDRPELTAEHFAPDSFSGRESGRLYRTGDLVYFRDDGVLEFIGRLDHQVKVRGYRVELGEIETRMLERSEVREAVVVAREDVPGDKRLVGYVVAESGASVDVGDLRSALRERLPEYMVPTNLVVVDAFPLTPNGKVDRNALPAPSEVSTAVAVEYEAPSDDVQAQIAAIWQDVLMVERIGVDDNFFELGGHSLLAVKAHRLMRDGVCPELSITDLFRFPTVKTLAAHLSDGEVLTGGRGVERAQARRDRVKNRGGDRRDRRRARQSARER